MPRGTLRLAGRQPSSLILLLVVAQLADLASSFQPRPPGWVAVERNPVAAALLANPPLAVGAKVAVIALVASTAAVAWPSHPRIAQIVSVAGIVAGLIGTLSNSTAW